MTMRRDQNLDFSGKPTDYTTITRQQKEIPMGGKNEPEEPDEQKPAGGEYLKADAGEASKKDCGVGSIGVATKPFKI
jgi:hypothetical protein